MRLCHYFSAVIALLWCVYSLGSDDTPLVLGVFPYLPAAQLEHLYAPVAAELSAASGREVQLRTRPSFDMFIEEVVQERYDLVFIQPFSFVDVARAHGYQSVARPAEPLKAVFVVRADSDIQNFDGLRDANIGTPPKQAAVSVLAQETLRQHGLIPGSNIRLTYQNNHAACLRAVLIRKASACITAPVPLDVFSERTGVTFRILGYSAPVPGSTYAVHRRLPASLREAITANILSWHKTTTGQSLLAPLKFSSFVASSNDDYLPVSEMLHVPPAPDRSGDSHGASNASK